MLNSRLHLSSKLPCFQEKYANGSGMDELAKNYIQNKSIGIA